MPDLLADFSLIPVDAAVMSNTLMTDDPWEPMYVDGIPQMLSAAMRPCLLAGPANAMRASSPVTEFTTWTASPTA